MKKALGFIGCCILLLLANWYLFTTSIVVLDNNSITIAQGDNYMTIKPRLLSNNRAYFSEYLYKIYVNLFGTIIKPGEKNFSSPPTLAELIDKLDDNTAPQKVRLPEGDTMESFASVLAEEGIVGRRDVLRCFSECLFPQYKDYLGKGTGYQGFLFPDTYLFAPGSKVETVVLSILGNFSSRVEPLKEKYALFVAEKGLRTVVIVASLLEREARTLEDKKMVAGILYRRQQLGMRLDVDATILYLKGDWRAPITVNDLDIDSPYNTRKYLGLPPGPICNPGIVSLEAAMAPKQSSYLYYLTGKDGQMHYANTLEAHVQNKWKYL